MKWYEYLLAPIKFIAALFTEADSNGGKPSFSRVAGSYVIYKIVYLTEIASVIDRANAVSQQLMTLFWVLIGYAIISKILSSLSPAVLDIFRALLLKAGAKVDIPDPAK
jgi:hypothetical protein